MSDEDKRRHPRVATRQPVWVEGQDVRVSAEAHNMSKGGMFVVAEANAPAVGSTLQVKFDDPHEGEVDVRMEVVWRNESGPNAKLGLRVLDSTGMEAFERVVSRHVAASGHEPRSGPPRPSEPVSPPAASRRPSDHE